MAANVRMARMGRPLAAVSVGAYFLACGAFGSSDEARDLAPADAASDGMHDGGGGGVADADRASSCPIGRGPEMVLVTISPTRGFCIDATEVTRAQYQAFLDTGPSPSDQPPGCAWNTSFLPTTGIVDFGQRDLPIVAVDWCDAYAFCLWAGKRLCGDVADGGPLPITAASDPTRSEWTAACTRNGSRPLPYGQNEIAGACNLHDDAGAAPVGSHTGCAGGYDGLVDMVGNVTEWENACDGLSDDGGGVCADRGGSFRSGGACSFVSKDLRTVRSSDWGIRCCATPR